MKIALSVLGKFHTFDLAQELHARNTLVSVLSGYPHFKLLAELLQQLADVPNLHEQKAARALGHVKRIGGWRDYGQNALNIIKPWCVADEH